jgi:hypothetical protein
MTLDELELIYAVLDNFRNSESCAEMLLTDETDDALLLIKREIKLKEMDPRK